MNTTVMIVAVSAIISLVVLGIYAIGKIFK